MRLNLAPGERVIVSSRPSARRLWRPVAVTVLAGAAAGFLVGFLGRDSVAPALSGWGPYLQLAVVAAALLVVLRWCLPVALQWSAARFILTSRRLLHRSGVLRRSEHEISLASVYQLEIRQGVSDRMQRSGTLVVDLGHGRVVPYRGVPEVHRFRSLVVAAIGQLPMTAMFDGVDMEGHGDYEDGGGFDE
ncbi:Bacterial membrane flanked domain protein [Arthrobacter saudimassiliensis]|uniref:Bacterial membrane flanked domain protein n=1 Tax=Arthrobacter saudimassiliensis TaxID=1461584 RepID=A0A078MMN5_9MICC|nr:Bacterial membrane flanked domain protein [Arthrobacter saudimassiliensis]